MVKGEEIDQDRGRKAKPETSKQDIAKKLIVEKENKISKGFWRNLSIQRRETRYRKKVVIRAAS